MTDNLYENIKKYRNNRQGAIKHLGIRVVDVRKGWAKCEILVEDHHINHIGAVHGGILFALADTVGGVAASSHGEVVTTANGSVQFLNAALKPKKVIAEATELKAGKNLLIYDVKIHDDQGKLICHATNGYSSLHKPLVFEEKS